MTLARHDPELLGCPCARPRNRPARKTALPVATCLTSAIEAFYTGLSDLSILDLSIYPVLSWERLPLWVEAEQYKVVGACLSAARRRANVTQQELAARLGKPQSLVSEYERGQRRIDVVELLVISRALGADPLELFAEIATASAASMHPKRPRRN